MDETTTILACDIGNTRIAVARVADLKAEAVQRIAPSTLGDSGALAAALDQAFAALWNASPRPKRIVASSVNPSHLAAVEAAAGRLGEEVAVIGRDLPLPMETAVRQPERVGTDRLCSAAMAHHRIGAACVVAQIGTAMTIDCVSDDGVFMGGAICVGPALAARALAERTAQLPRVELVRPEWVFGRDTREAILSGVVSGARGALRELVETYATELGKWPPLIVTGGDAELVAGGYDIVDAIVPDLCLMGVALGFQRALNDTTHEQR